MKYRKIGLLVLIPALALLLFGVNARAPAAHATVTSVVTITKTDCITLTGNVDWNDSGTIDSGDGATGVSVCGGLDTPDNFHALIRVLGGDPDNPQPSDLTKLDLDAGQVHEKDGIEWVIAFVSSDTPVSFYADNGTFSEGKPVPRSDLFCGRLGDPGVDYSDPDCYGTGGDGVVVVQWTPNGAERGPGTFTVRQGNLETTADYTIVGEPAHVSLKAFDTAIQINAPICLLFSDTPSFLEAVTEPETSPLAATVTDSDGTSITGALIQWSVDDSDKLSLVIPDPLRVPFTPSVDLQALGHGAPEMACGGDDTGNVKITATVTDGSDALPSHLGLDPGGKDGPSVSITLPVQSEPVAMSLAAVPPSLVCDGTATSDVSANLSDDANKAVVNGNLVHFTVKALGSANPIDGRSTDGVAKSAITPLSGAINGVLVQATWMRHVVKGPTPTPVFTPIPLDQPFPTTPTPVFTPKAIPLEFVPSSLDQSILVNCEQNPATVGELPGSAPAGAPGAVIAPPRTGSGGGEASPWLVALPLGAFALLLVGSGLALRRRKA